MNTAAVNRGYLKIEGAVRAFNFDFRGKTVLDIGSSTGGFTEYALSKGAKKVIAVEKGSRQMKAPLRFDPRIELHEKTDIFDVRIRDNISEDRTRQRERVASEPHNRLPLGTQTTRRVDGRERSGSEEMLSRISITSDSVTGTGSKEVLIYATDVIVADVSFLSLTKILKYAKIHLSRSNTDFLVMLKPQFEARPDQLKDGVVKNETIRRGIIKHFEFWLKTNGFIIVNKHDNELHGKTGNIERFYWLKKAGNKY